MSKKLLIAGILAITIIIFSLVPLKAQKGVYFPGLAVATPHGVPGCECPCWPPTCVCHFYD